MADTALKLTFNNRFHKPTAAFIKCINYVETYVENYVGFYIVINVL